jgi:hypothetical protein
LVRAYEPARAAYRAAGAAERLALNEEPGPDAGVAGWLLEALRGR